MTKKSKKKNWEEIKKENLLKIKKKPKNIKELSKGDKVLLLSGSLFIKEKNRLGKIVKIEKEDIHLKFPIEDTITRLKFYGISWGLLK